MKTIIGSVLMALALVADGARAQQAPQRPQALYFESISALDTWTPGADPDDAFRIGFVPLRRRPPSAEGTQLLHCHDFKGGYVEDADLYPQGTNNPNTYNFSNWQYLDQFIYFSHHRVTLPPPWWINAAHQNGVPVLGTLIFETGSGPDLEKLIRGKPGAPLFYADKLVQTARYYGFDGWLWNVETPLPPGVDMGDFTRFVNALTQAMHQKLPGSRVLWYDSLIGDNTISYQNQLNDQNNVFFAATDGLLTNYWWQPAQVADSAKNARAQGRSPFAVYTGTDVWGRDTYLGGGFNSYNALKANVNQTSAFLFAPGWTFEQASDYADYVKREARFWTGTTATHCPGQNQEGIAQVIPERPVPAGLPFGTNFDLGRGTSFWVAGTKTSSTGWSNLSLQGLLPTWRFCPEDNAGPFTADFDQAQAHDGGASLLVRAQGATGKEQVTYRLFSLDAPLPKRTVVRWAFQPLDRTHAPAVALKMVFSDGTSRVLQASKSRAEQGWQVATSAPSGVAGKRLKELDLVVGPTTGSGLPGKAYGVRVGMLSVTDGSDPLPPPVSGLAEKGTTVLDNQVTLTLRWDYREGAARYFDVWKLGAKGTRTWLLRTASKAAWLENVPLEPDGTVTLAVQPVDFSGARRPVPEAARYVIKKR